MELRIVDIIWYQFGPGCFAEKKHFKFVSGRHRCHLCWTKEIGDLGLPMSS